MLGMTSFNYIKSWWFINNIIPSLHNFEIWTFEIDAFNSPNKTKKTLGRWNYLIIFDFLRQNSALDIAVEREVEGDLLELDAGMGVPFRPGTFDGCIRLL